MLRLFPLALLPLLGCTGHTFQQGVFAKDGNAYIFTPVVQS